VNEGLQNTICCIIIQNCHYMQWLALYSATRLLLSLQHLM